MISTGICRWLFLVVSLTTWIIETSSKEMRVVCYYTNWSVYRPGSAKFSPQNINPYMCTHLIYAFGGFTKENTLKPFDKYQDIEKGGYAKFTGLKTYNKDLKTLIAIGGWNEGSSRFSSMVANPDRRKELVKNAIKFLRLNHFDGLDLDWEYPAFRDGGKPRDRDNYANLVQELREEFDRETKKTGRPRLLLTMAVPAGIEYINKGFDVPKLTKYLDWMNILSYDYHSAFEPAVNHHAPLYSLEEDNEYNYDGDLNIDHTIKHYLKLGALPEKLVLGIPTYGRSYTLFNPDAYEIGSPADGPGTMGEATRENGYLAYYEICDNVKNQDWEVEQPNPDAMGPIAFKDDQWVGYDDENIVKRKAEYVAENGLGGIMFWAIDNDDFRGTCHGKPYPLIEAGREALINAYGITEDNLIVPPSKQQKTRTRTKTKLASRTKQPETENVVEKSTKPSRRRTRVKSNTDQDESKDAPADDSKRRRNIRRKNSREHEEPTSYSSLKVVTPMYTTPAPPSTPDLDGAFKCEDEGFFSHPKDCKKYFWCLSGAGDSGIVAHQFTCPAGLYFNKAADSCDYTQNVLCNKKLSKTSKSTTTEGTLSTSTTTAPTTASTTRAPPRITAATSRTTFRQTTTTTEAYEEDEYEYDDDEEDEKLSKEEDPRVIKELIDLIKKAGGIEELEKQLKLSKEGSSSQTNQLTTQSPISKSLYERVLSKTLKNTPPSRKNSYVSSRNSRGPQSEGLSTTVEKTSTRSETPRGKLSYTTISRNRPAASKTTEDEDEDGSDEDGSDEDDDKGKSRNTTEKSRIEYVDIRRNRNRGSTTAKPEDKKVFNRNQILGEDDETNDESDDETDDEEEETDNTNSSKKSVYTPQYVNIRRSRPSTTEEPEASKYVQLRRGTTESTEATTESSSDRTTSKYKFIRRGSTSTEEPEEESSTARYQTTSSASAATSDDNISTKKYLNLRRGPTTELFSSVSDNTNSSFSSEMPTSKVTETTTPTPRTTEELGSTSQTSTTLTSDTQQEIKKETFNNIPTLLESISSVKDNLNTNETENSTYNIENTTDTSSSVISQDTSGDVSQPIKRPQLFNPRPFSKSTRGTTTPKPTIEPSTSKVSQSNLKYRLKIDNSEPEETKLYKTRGSSRFNSNIPTRQEDKSPDYFPQKRRISTTEKYVEENRSYRPSELADLSSLTAADFSRVSDLDLARATNRRRRPTVTSTISEEASEINTTPSTRKLDSVSSFGRRRKLIRGKPDPTKTEDENTSTTKRIRGFGSRSTREPSTTESIFSSSAAFNLLSRNRKVIRRLKTSTPIPSSTHKVEDDLNDDSDFQENRVEDENDDEDPVIEEEENIKLSESNIRENSAINSFGPDPKLRRKLVGSGKSYLPEKPVTDQQLSTSSYNVEMSDVDEFSSVKKSTEPNIVVRTRKIVRKLIPTEPTIRAEEEFESEQSFGRKRKIIRKLRPISQFNRIEDNKETVKLVTTYKHTDEPLEITTVDNISSHEDVTTPDEVDDATAGSKENKSTNVSEPSSEKTLNLPKTLPQPEITGESDSSSKKSIEPKNLFTPEPTENSELSTEKPLVGSKRLFRPKLYNSRNKSDSKLNSSEGISKNSEIIRITNSSGTDNSRRVASRGRNKIFRPKIIEARNRFKDDKETLSTEKRLPNTQRLSLYSRRPNILKSTDDENSSTENVISSSSASDEELNDYSDKDDHNSNDHPENHDSVSTTEFISSKYTELNFKKYNRYRRPNEQPNSIRTKSTTIIETEENSPNENRITSPEVVSSTPVYTDIKMTSQEIDDPDTNNELSTSEYAEVEDITTEYSIIMNTTEYEVPNVTETYTIEILPTEFVTIASDSETYMTPEIDTERDEEIRINETIVESNKASTSASLYEITTSGAIVTNDIDNTFVNETFSDSIGPTTLKDGFETPEVSTENSDQTYFETTIIPDTTTEDILPSEKIVGDISSSSTIGSTTQQHRTITLRPIGARPKFVPPRLKDLSIGQTTESVAKPSKAYGGNRLKLTTADDSSINDSSDPDTVPEKNTESRSKLSPKYSTTERNRFNKYKKGYNSGLRTTANIQNPKVTVGNRVESSSKSINTFLYKYSTTENSNSESDDGDDEEEESNIQEPTEDSLLGNKYKKGYNSALRTTENVKNPEVTEDSDIESSSAKSINIFLYKYSTTENLNSEFDDGDDEVEEEISIQEPTEDSILVNKYKKGYNSALRTTDNVKNPEVTEDSHFGRSSTKSINRFLYKYSTTENLNSESDDDDDEESNVQDPSGDRDEEIIEGIEETIPQVSDSAPKSRKPNTPAFAKKNTIRLSNKPFFSKPSTENSKIEESLKDIDTEAIKNRNKSLFSKNRMMNAPLSVQSTTNLPTTDIEETTSSSNDIDSQYSTIEYSTTSTKLIETTEDLTTLHHIFAESTDGVRSTTDAMNDKTETTTSKVERLIEVNRIIKVETKEEHDKNHIIEMNSEEVSPIQNKVGEVNRVTVIKVVDTDDHMKNKNEGMIPISPVYIQKNTTSTESAIKSSVDMIIQIAKVQEIPATDILERVNLTNISVSLNTSGIPLPPQREGRKFEIFGVGGSKIADNKNVNQFIGKADIIYGISNINVVTPRSAHNTESSTISLEGLFRTEGSTLFSKTPTINDELLETDHSKFVNVRVLHPDESMRVNKEHTKSGKVIPIKILKQDDDEYAMKADVIEVPAKPNLETIKIAPIKVEMSKSIASNLPLIRFSSKSLPTV